MIEWAWRAWAKTHQNERRLATSYAKIICGAKVGGMRDITLDARGIADDIRYVNKGRSHITLAAAARHLGVQRKRAAEILIDVARRKIGKRKLINVMDLARFINSGTTFVN